jgi:hypothetical protein
MKHKGLRIALITIEAIIGLCAVGGGIALLSGAFAQWLPNSYLQGTPFSDYLIPSLVLIIVVGGGMLLTAAAQLVQREWTLFLSAVMGLIMVGFEVAEVAIINRYQEAVVFSTVLQQVLFSVLGLVIIGLAGYLWTMEYHGGHLLGGHASHA